MNEDEIFWRRLPPELLAEMHKCLPLADAINVLVNVPTRAIYQNNSPRMRRTIQRIKTSLNEYIGTLVGDESENNREELKINNNIEWKPQLGTLLRYGSWLTKTRQFTMFSRNIIGVPENFLGELLLHLANSSLTQMMLKRVEMNFEMEQIPSFLKKLFNVKQNRRILFEYVNLETDNDGQTLPIFEGELYKCYPGYKLILILMNKMAQNNWFQILLSLDSTKKYIRRMEFESTNWPLDNKFKFLLGWSSNVFEAKENIMWTPNLDMFLRRGAGLTPIQHFRMKKQYYFNSLPTRYINFLINYISNTKYPNELLESFSINFANRCCSSSSFIDKIYQNEIPKGGIFISIDGTKKLHILSAKIAKTNKKLEFTLANIPTNGQYRFDVTAEFIKGSTKIIRIKIIKRKIENIIQMKYQNEIELGMKRKTTTTNDNEDEPTYSGKIMKK